MVFFTCNNCGDSLKKKDCANHAWKCRPLALTCVDCHKDFFGDQYAAHTSCVTEAEKYGVKGFRSPVPSTAGMAKQKEWSCAVLSASKASELTTSQKYFLGILTQHPNVPRKKMQFQNFANSVWKASYHQMPLVEQVYNMIESELNKAKGLPKEDDLLNTRAGGNVEVKGGTEDMAPGSEVGNTTSMKANGNKGEILGESSGNGVEKKTGDASITNSSSTPKKSKKKRKKEIKDSENTRNQIPFTVENDKESKKSKRKKRKQESEEEMKQNGNGMADECGNPEDSTSKNGKRKKRKHKDTQEEEIILNGNGILGESINAEDGTSTKDKRKKKLSEVDENGSVPTIEDFPKKSHKKKDKKNEENNTKATSSSDKKEETLIDDGKEKSKKKKKHKLQEAMEEVPTKKSKSTIG